MMATISDFAIIQKMIDDNGYSEDDPRVYKIVKYTNSWGGVSYGVTWEGHEDLDRYEEETEYVINPEVIWTSENE